MDIAENTGIVDYIYGRDEDGRQAVVGHSWYPVQPTGRCPVCGKTGEHTILNKETDDGREE
jgi:hypothetical protein